MPRDIRTQRSTYRQSLWMLVMLAVLPIAPALAVSGLDPEQPINYGLHWFRMNADAPGTPECGGEPGHECLDAVIFDSFNTNWIANPNSTSGDDPFYDPTQPTIIYFHGWQPFTGGSGSNREGFLWKDTKGNLISSTLQAWKDQGWNVGVFYWDQFARTSLTGGPSRAESKIWSSASNTGLQYRWGSNGRLNANPLSLALGLPAISDYTGSRWANLNNTQKANALVRFANALQPSNAPDIANHVKSLFQANNDCEAVVKDYVCSFNTPLCNGSETRYDWRELFFSKICQAPSVGDLAVFNLDVALASQSNDEVIFAGHSLGHQLATRTATHMWMAYRHYDSLSVQGQLAIATTNLSALPKRLELLDPYASSSTASYLKPYPTQHTGVGHRRKNARNRHNTSRVYHYVRRLKDLTVGYRPEIENFPVSYYHTSSLSRLSAYTTNPELIEESAYQRIHLDYENVFAQTYKHQVGKYWYFSSQKEALFYPSLVNSAPWLTYGYGLSAKADDNHVVDAMNNLANEPTGIALDQAEGTKTSTPTDDKFRAHQHYSDLPVFASLNLDVVPDVDDLRGGLRRHLFDSSLVITADNVIDAIYVNGEDVTGDLLYPGRWEQADRLLLPLHNGKNVIAVQARDSGGQAALIAEIDSGPNTFVSDELWQVTTSTPANDWMEIDFDDSSWSDATVHGDFGDAPWNHVVAELDGSRARWIWSSDDRADDTVYFRYTIHGLESWKVRVAESASPVTNFSQAASLIDAAIQNDLADGSDDESFVEPLLNFSSNGLGGRYSGKHDFPGPPSTNSFALFVEGTVAIETADTYTFGVGADDGARIVISKDGVDHVVVSRQGSGESLGQIDLVPGTYQIEILYYNSSGGSELEVFVAKGDHTSWNADDFKLLLPYDNLDHIDQTENSLGGCLTTGLAVDKTSHSVKQHPYNVSFSSPEGIVRGFLAQMQTYSGPDTAAVRVDYESSTGIPTSTATIHVEEEKTLDNEIGHASETIGHITITDEHGEIRNADDELIGYIAEWRLGFSDWQTFTIPRGFVDPVVIGTVQSNYQEDAHVRIQNVSSNGTTTTFQQKIEKFKDVNGGLFFAEWVNFIVIEAGTHTMRDGQVIQVGTTSITQSSPEAFTTISFPTSFDATPVVLSLAQTTNDTTPIVTRHRNVHSSQFQLLVQEAEAENNIHGAETIGWLAVLGSSTAVDGGTCDASP